MDLADATAADFVPLVNEKFSVEGAGSLVLSEVEEKSTLRSDSRKSFALVFRSVDGKVMPQQIYRLEHEKTGKMDIFLVPVSRDDNSVSYEAVFN